MSQAKELIKEINDVSEAGPITMNLSSDAMTNLKRDMLKDSGKKVGDKLKVGSESLGGNWEFKISQKELDKFLDVNELDTTLKKGDIAIIEKGDPNDVWGKVTGLKK